MKKKAAAWCAAALAALLAVSLTACSSAEKMKSEEVTAEEWTAAFAEGNFANVRMEAEQKSVRTGKTSGGKVDVTQTVRLTAVIAGDLEYYKMEVTETGKVHGVDISDPVPAAEMYSAKTEEGMYTVYTRNGAGKWTTSVSAVSVAADFIAEAIASFAGNFEDYVYSADRRGYVRSDDTDGSGEVLKFADKKLAAVWQSDTSVDYDDIDYTYAIRVSSTASMTLEYGGQSITLPAVSS